VYLHLTELYTLVHVEQQASFYLQRDQSNRLGVEYSEWDACGPTSGSSLIGPVRGLGKHWHT